MSLLKMFFGVITLLTLMLIILGQTLPSHKMNLKKISPYECGFDPMKSTRLPFSFRFFLVAILFLLFDLEMALLLPLPMSFKLSKTKNSLWVFSTFMVILTYGLFFEWIKGGLDWAKD